MSVTTTTTQRAPQRFAWRWVLLSAGLLALIWATAVESPSLSADLGVHGRLVTVYLIALVIGELARVRMPGGRNVAPIASASALALAFTYHVYAEPDFAVRPAFIVLVVVAGLGMGALVRWLSGLQVGLAQVAARTIGVAIAAWAAHRWQPFAGHSIAQMSEDPAIPLFVVASLMVLVGFTAVSAEVALSGLLRAERLGTRLGPALLDELGEALPLTAAVVVAGPFTALMQPVLGLATLPFTLFPVGLTYVAVRRYAANRTTYREIISTLSRMTERGRYTPVDHAQRVAALSVRIGRRLGMAERSIPNLEFAALLHDLGQIALREPIPGGATTSAAPADQAQIAADGAAIVRSTEVLEQVARYIELQAVPYRLVREDDVPVPIESRIIKVANAFDDLTGGHVTPESKASALERLSLGLGYEYDPDVVEALAEVVESASSPRELHFDR